MNNPDPKTNTDRYPEALRGLPYVAECGSAAVRDNPKVAVTTLEIADGWTRSALRWRLQHKTAGYDFAGSMMRLDPEMWSVNAETKDATIVGESFRTEAEARACFARKTVAPFDVHTADVLILHHVRASGPVSRQSIAVYLTEQMPGACKRAGEDSDPGSVKAWEIVDARVSTLIRWGYLTEAEDFSIDSTPKRGYADDIL